MSTMFADTVLIVFISVCTALLAEGITWVLVYRTDKYKRLKAEVEKQSKKCEEYSEVNLPGKTSSKKSRKEREHLVLGKLFELPYAFLDYATFCSALSSFRHLATLQNGGCLGIPPGQNAEKSWKRRTFVPDVEKKKETITESAGRQQKKKIERQEEKLKNNNRDLSMVRMKSMFAIGFCFTALMGMFNSIFDGRVVAKLPFVPLSYIQGLSHRNLLGEDYTDCSFIFLYILCTMSIRQNIQKLLGLAPSRAATKQAGGFLGPPPQPGKFS